MHKRLDTTYSMINSLDQHQEEKKVNHENLLNIKSVNKWNEEASKKPNPKMLFDKFWYEGEVCIFFADTNLGKSVLAVQIADSISKGIPIPGFRMETLRQKVLYCDFELTDKQFQIRYTNEENNKDIYQFDDDLLRAEINPEFVNIPKEFKDFNTFISYILEQTILSESIQVLIVDNITYLNSDTEKTKEGFDLMKNLKLIKNKYKISILALAHTPKRASSKPIVRNDLMGSSNLANFCDSSFAMGDSSRGSNLRYIKPIKIRNTAKGDDFEDVYVVSLGKSDNFLHFEFKELGYEKDHLKIIDKKKAENEIIAMHKKHPNLSERKIAKKLNFAISRVNRCFKDHGLRKSDSKITESLEPK